MEAEQALSLPVLEVRATVPAALGGDPTAEPGSSACLYKGMISRSISKHLETSEILQRVWITGWICVGAGLTGRKGH